MRESESGRIVISHEFYEFIDLFCVIDKSVEWVLVVVETDERGDHDTVAEGETGVAPLFGGADGLELQGVEVQSIYSQPFQLQES